MDHLAMKVAIRPRFWKNALAKVLKRLARSAASTPGAGAKAASQTPGPVSQCSPSTSSRSSRQASMNSANKADCAEARSME